MSQLKHEHTLDVRGQLCPMPVIKTQGKIKDLVAGDILLILATDPGVKHDIPAWCRIHQHELLSVDDCEGEIHMRVQVVK